MDYLPAVIGDVSLVGVLLRGLHPPSIASSAAAAAAAEWEQRLHWPGSLQVVELLFTFPGGAVFTPEELLQFNAPIHLRHHSLRLPCRRHRSAVPAPPPPSAGVSSGALLASLVP